MQLTSETTLADIVRAMPEEWRDRLRAARLAEEPVITGALTGQGGRCLMAIALAHVHIIDGENTRVYNQATDFFEGYDNWYTIVDPLLRRARDRGSVWDTIGEAL